MCKIRVLPGAQVDELYDGAKGGHGRFPDHLHRRSWDVACHLPNRGWAWGGLSAQWQQSFDLELGRNPELGRGFEQSSI
ncbi:hypothetical protein MCOR27_006439 [Pyricularia oryzae]|uniref:Uncharacterized protein n=4 Tax=Pyricularia oryzae TaxID=318829 RepID=G4MLN9_PYRO7|nr:uncharacterized protein MGG_16165 [Pyricularia oryzae 70-15]ELQ38589.1 hypothetical protein OOU_Y34scaffold00534g64 [Pyricularia oryzae Y34]KAH8842365.1 hypothetical protein MCOR01_006273 [Pyricularia oryzae]EHA56872.1 hypothetical protein MGG_16165 [Pyricularia oryzae 70-15]KAI6258909.1 hypothetical protein MCOR19_004751 [Pyricularia oryzae]KAI6276547.1 hypothetical protein MCOR27_006439 [Pyricularia oryzae]